MAAAGRVSRNTYRPVSSDDTGQDRSMLTRSGSLGSVSLRSPRRKPSLWIVSLVVLGLCVLFLIGFALGFYVRETQSQGGLEEQYNSDHDGAEDKVELASIHDEIMYRIRGPEIQEFLDKFSFDDPVSGSLVERKIEQNIKQLLEEYTLDHFEIEEHEMVVTYADPAQPNKLQILRKDNHSVIVNMTLKNLNTSSINNLTQELPHTTTEDWKYPFVAFSPAGEVEGTLVYGHYGTESDLLILQAKQISLKNRLVLLRLGKLSLAEKVKNVAEKGAAGVLAYWDPADANDNVQFPSDYSYIPYATAAVYTTDSASVLVPTIPVQTVSTAMATTLLTLIAQEADAVAAPSSWNGGLGSIYLIGRKNNSGNIVGRLSTFNIKKQHIVRNIISNIHGTSEKDRYVIIGAPRASLPGVKEDVIISTALLLQVARSLTTSHRMKKWKPRRTIRIVSWGGGDLANIGMLQHIKTNYHLLSQRAVAYFDINQLMVGKDVITARVPPGLFQIINEVSMVVPDPNDRAFSVQTSWENLLESGAVPPGSVAVPLTSYHGDSSATPFLHVLGVPTVSLQYRNIQKPADELSVGKMMVEDRDHHYKYHVAVVRIMVQTLLSVVDNDVIPYSLTGAVRELGQTLWQTSDLLDQCSHSMQDLAESLRLLKSLEQTAKTLEEYIGMYKDKYGISGLRMVNDIKMIFERLFVVNRKGISHHILYPAEAAGSISEVSQLCSAGEIAEVWDYTAKFVDSMEIILIEAVAALRRN